MGGIENDLDALAQLITYPGDGMPGVDPDRPLHSGEAESFRHKFVNKL